jgi:hypothetical protein
MINAVDLQKMKLSCLSPGKVRHFLLIYILGPITIENDCMLVYDT